MELCLLRCHRWRARAGRTRQGFGHAADRGGGVARGIAGWRFGTEPVRHPSASPPRLPLAARRLRGRRRDQRGAWLAVPVRAAIRSDGPGVTTTAFAFSSLLTIPVFDRMWVYALSIAVAFVMAMVLTVLFGYRTPSRATKTQMVSADENARPQDMARGIDTTVSDVESAEDSPSRAALIGLLTPTPSCRRSPAGW